MNRKKLPLFNLIRNTLTLKKKGTLIIKINSLKFILTQKKTKDDCFRLD